MEGKNIIVSKLNSCLNLYFSDLEGAEIYLYFDNIDYVSDRFMSSNITVTGLLDGKNINPQTVDSFSILTKEHHMYGGKTQWILNLGIAPQTINGIQITFANPGQYNIDDIHIYARHINSIAENIRGLDHDGISNIVFLDNEIDLKVSTDNDRYLFAAIPYSNGWEAYDNGVKTNLIKADVGFLGLNLSSGDHEISFKYHTPGFLPGVCISAFSLFGYLLFLHEERKKEQSKSLSVRNTK